MTNNEILSEVQRLCALIHPHTDTSESISPAEFILRALDWALSTGREQELAKVIQPWLIDQLLGVVQDVTNNLQESPPGSINLFRTGSEKTHET